MTQLTHNNMYDTSPSYSPDGKKIVYTVSKGNAESDIYTINAFGGVDKPPTTTRTKAVLPGESSVAASPAGEEGTQRSRRGSGSLAASALVSCLRS